MRVAALVSLLSLGSLSALLACDKPQDNALPAASASASAAAAIASTTTTPPGASSSPAVASAAAATPQSAPDAIIAQHVLVAYKGAKGAPKSVTRSKADAKTRAQEALGKIRSGAVFEDIVKSYSDDTGTVDRMGSIGKRQRQDLDPAFATAAFALKVGDVSDVVESPFGFHIIKRTQ
jgi:PPIC-type peptidyl-prolyl cis-trans isomerase-like protein